jgi:hypothetical protein
MHESIPSIDKNKCISARSVSVSEIPSAVQDWEQVELKQCDALSASTGGRY